jgi:hypothetical protein
MGFFNYGGKVVRSEHFGRFFESIHFLPQLAIIENIAAF